MSDLKTRPRQAIACETDFHAWSKDQVSRLREPRPNSMDWENVAVEPPAPDFRPDSPRP